MFFDRKSAKSLIEPNDAAAMERSRSSGHGEGLSSPLTTIESIVIKIPEPYVVPISGGLAGAASGIVSCPLDVIKTKLQAQGGFKTPKEAVSLSAAAYRGVHGTAAIIWKEDGIRGLYRGLGPMLLGYVPTWAVYLTVYNKAQAFFRTKTGKLLMTLTFFRLTLVPDNFFLANVYSSISGGACSTMVTNPIWVIKTRLMSQSSSKAGENHYRPPWHYHNTLDAARKMYRGEGILSFYSGLTPALFGLTHVAIQFPLYEVFKAKFTGIGVGVKETDEDRRSHFYGLSLAVFLSKIIASTATYPHEVVRTRLQTQQRSPANHTMEGSDSGKASARDSKLQNPSAPLRYRGTVETCKAILVEEGWRGFYAGLGTNLIRAVPSAMTTILTFEYLKKAFFDHQRDGRAKLEFSKAAPL